jgi:hypothetical protein
MYQQVDEANNLIKQGEFEKSKILYSNLLDYQPNDKLYISGFFISYYWDNRIDKILATPEGKERGLLLISLFDKFEEEYFERKYPISPAYDSILKCILEESCIQLKLGFQKLGSQAFGKETYLLLAKCLLRIEDYKNCLEILEYSKKFIELTPDYYYFKAECFYHLKEVKKSRLMFRSTLLYFYEKLPIHILKSQPLMDAWNEIILTLNREEAIHYLPVYCLEKNLLPEINDYSKEEILDLWSDIQKLLDVNAEFKPETNYKIKYNILHYGMTILDSFYGQLNKDLSSKVKLVLEQLDPGINERRNAFQQKINQVEEDD